ncbi:amidohydrolase family protein [Hymenobacter metallicola]|uniref:Amidohydrolase n=1 Tax=Hymenobacter metallicola TaxID=2563114 RepID=A0A4Z0QFI5_9BACT|nr:amidohydrolase family protein [Hymenobacter metallicola]TGE28818.1 amidohydrolase [Hymenobacter metallicola]
MLIIDCHCHAGQGDGLTGPWDTDAPLEPYLAWADEAGIQRTVLFAAFHSDYAVANRQVARLVRQQPGRFYGFAFVHAQRDRGRIRELVTTAVQQYGFCGIKSHRFDARISREICDVARAFRLPVLYDVVGEIAVVELLGEQYPDVNFIIPHLGSFSDDWRAQAGLIDHLVRFPNIYTDTSGVRRFDILQRAVDRAGAHKFLFGSDGPWLHPGVELAKIRALHLGTEETRQVVAGNLLRLLATVRRHPLPGALQQVAVPAAELSNAWRDPWLMRP